MDKLSENGADCLRFVRADHTGSWMMHLRSVLDCLPIVAVVDHFNYRKCAYLYLQEMSQLRSWQPSVYDNFSKAFHVVHRSNQFWVGLSSNLVLEHTLMRSLKSSGGLTHGIWNDKKCAHCGPCLHLGTTMPCMNSIISHKQRATQRSYRSMDETWSRWFGNKIKENLSTCILLSSDSSPRNIIIGIVAKEGVNVHESESVATAIVETMIGKPVFGTSFKHKGRARTLADQSTIKVAKDRVIQPDLLFQIFLVVSKSGELSL